MKTYTTYLAVRIEVAADNQRQAEDAAEDIRSRLEAAGALPGAAVVQAWLGDCRFLPKAAGPEFSAN